MTRAGPARAARRGAGLLIVARLRRSSPRSAFAIGRFSTFGARRRGRGPATDSAEAGFARDMQVHHAQAIEMAMEIYRTTDDPELRMLAYDIATGQAGQRGEMFDWLVQWGLPQSGGPMMAWMAQSDARARARRLERARPLTDEQARQAMGMATDAELSALASATGTEADCHVPRAHDPSPRGRDPHGRGRHRARVDSRACSQVAAEHEGRRRRAEIDAMQSMQTASRLQRLTATPSRPRSGYSGRVTAATPALPRRRPVRRDDRRRAGVPHAGS